MTGTMNSNITTKAGRVKYFRRKARRFVNTLGLDVERWPHSNSLDHLISEVLLKYQIDAVIDVGANVGDWSRTIRRLGYAGFILSVEPVAGPFEELRRRSAGDHKWVVVNRAVGSREGQVEMRVARSSTTSSLLPAAQEYVERYEGSRTIGTQAIQMMTLDTLVNELPASSQRILLKIDTQGYDMHVLDGATAALNQVVALQMEVSLVANYDGASNDIDAVMGRTRELGFVPSGFYPIERDLLLRLTEMDGVFVRPGRST